MFHQLTIFILLIPIACVSQPGLTSMHQSKNMVANGDFMARDYEQRPLHWITGRQLQSATIVSRPKHGRPPDDLALKLHDSVVNAELVVRTQKYIAAPATTYTAKAWFKGQEGKPSSLHLEFWDQNNARIAVSKYTPPFDTAWKEAVITASAPDKCTHVTIALISSKEDTGISFCDDVSLVYAYPYQKRISKGQRELFLDDYRIETMWEVSRKVHPADKTKPLITPTEPWEGNATYIYGTVLVDQPAGSTFRMWYTSYVDGVYYLCYATSKDGTRWVKPKLGLVDFNGSKNNNLVKVGGGTVVYDSAASDVSKRYKLMAFTTARASRPIGYSVWFSADGLRWTEYKGNPVITYGDVSNVAYDKENNRFIASTKQRMLVSNTSVTANKMDRSAFISVSEDFIHWTAPGAPGSSYTLAVEGDRVDDMIVMSKGGLEGQIYGMTVHPYHGIYIGLPWCFDVINYHAGIFAGYGDGPIQPQIAASRDLVHWSRPSRQPVLPIGEAGAWDDGTLYTSSTMHITPEKIEMYYGAMNLPHGGDKGTQKQMAQIAKASWRRDGFMSLHNAGFDTGFITTKPFLFEGRQLKLNARLFPSGFLKVEILDNAGNVIPGYAVSDATAVKGDQLAHSVSWKNRKDLSLLSGREIKLRFYLKGGDLYSYWFDQE